MRTIYTSVMRTPLRKLLKRREKKRQKYKIYLLIDRRLVKQLQRGTITGDEFLFKLGYRKKRKPRSRL